VNATPNDRIEEALVALVRRATDPRGNQRINALAGTDIERAGSVMLHRVGELQPARLSQLAEAAGVEVSTASRQVARLVERGYVARQDDPNDGRATVHRLTDDGRDLLQRLVAARHEWFDTLLAEFETREREQLADLLGRLVDRIRTAM
jgi:DNA-binding MarR family transcriptional regulator